MTISILQHISGEGANPAETQVHGVSQAFASNVTVGSTIVCFETMSDYAGVHSGQTCTDTLGNSFSGPLNQQNTSQTGGAQSILQFYAYNSSAGADTVANAYSPDSVEDYTANYLIEIGGALTGSNPFIGSNGNTQNNCAPGTNNVTSGTVTVTSAQVPCLLVGISVNSSGNGGYIPPSAGSNSFGALTKVDNCWYFQTANANGTVVSQYITSAGTYAAVFNQASSANEDMASLVMIFQAASSGPAPSGPLLYHRENRLFFI